LVPLVSIVTPTLNAARFLRQSMESVLSQDYSRIEYLVVDSHSDDGTGAILRSYDGRVRTIFAAREGPASAIHTGLTQAHGSIFAWLGADNVYEPAAVKSAVSVLLEHPGTDVVYGDASWIDDRGAFIGRYPTMPFAPAQLARHCFISQPASFFRAPAYRQCSFDPSLALSYDYDLWIRLAADGRRFEYLPRMLARSRMHRECLTLACRRQVFEATMDLLRKHYGYVPLPWIFGYLSYRCDGGDQFFEPLRFSPAVFAFSLLYGPAANRTHARRFLAEWIRTGARGVRQLSQLASGSAVNQATAPGRSPAESPEAAE
jgi:glycosyltransferase involved in cell wall biosynthesis